jgi:hypothetical protein
VVVRRHQAEGMADDQPVAAELADQLHACEVVAVVAEDVLLGDRSRRDVEDARVIWPHRSSVPAAALRVCAVSVETLGARGNSKLGNLVEKRTRLRAGATRFRSLNRVR